MPRCFDSIAGVPSGVFWILGKSKARLASAEIAHLLETMMALAGPTRLRARPEVPGGQQIRFARTCYDYLAGRLGVALTEGLVKRGFLSQEQRDFMLTPTGTDWFVDLGMDPSKLKIQRRQFARACLDWSERRPHLAGALGASLAARFFDLGWTAHRNRPNQAVIDQRSRYLISWERGRTSFSKHAA